MAGFGMGIRVDEGATNLIALSKRYFEGMGGTYQGAVQTLTQNINMPEWNTNQATRMQFTGGTSTTKWYASLTGLTAGKYSWGIYVKNMGMKAIVYSPDDGASINLAPGESKLIQKNGLDVSAAAFSFFRFVTLLVEDTIDVIVYEPYVYFTPYSLTYTPSYRAPEVLTMETYKRDAVNPTNLLTENQSGVETDTSGFSPRNGATLSRNTTEKWQGNASLQVTTLGAKANEGVEILFPSQCNGSYILQCRMKGTGAISILNIGGNMNYVVNNVTLDAANWVQYTLSFTTTALTSVAGIRIQTTGTLATTFYLDGLMLEAGSRCGSWVPGGTRRILDATQGEIGMMVKIDAVTRRNDGNYNRILLAINAASGNALTFLHETSGSLWRFMTTDDAGVQSTVNFADSATSDGWHRLVFVWNSTSAKVFVDGTVVATLNAPHLSSSFHQFIYIGSHHNKVWYINTLFDDIYFRSEPRSDAEIAVNSLTPWVWDAKTTALVKFDGANARRYGTRTEL
jgi:hypothetical protein